MHVCAWVRVVIARLAKENSSLKCSGLDGTYKTGLGDQIKQEDRAYASVIQYLLFMQNLSVSLNIWVSYD